MTLRLCIARWLVAIVFGWAMSTAHAQVPTSIGVPLGPDWRFNNSGNGTLCLQAMDIAADANRLPLCFTLADGGHVSFSEPTTFSTTLAPRSGAAVGPTFSAHNTGDETGVGLLAQYFSGASAPTFDLGAEFIATFNPVIWRQPNRNASGPGYMAQWVVALSPNDRNHNWGANIVEYNIVNRGPDMGWHRDRAFQPVTGGLVVVPETLVFGDQGGGEGTNVTYAYTAAHSALANSHGQQGKFYNDYLCEPNSEAGRTGRCLYATGDLTGDATQVPYGPLQADGTWLHGIDLTAATFTDGLGVGLRVGQAIGFSNLAGVTATVGGQDSGRSVDLVLSPGGSGQTEIRSGAVVDGPLAAQTLVISGHVSFAGSAIPTATVGRVRDGSSDSRGTVALASGTLRTTVTFATPFASPPFCVLTGNRVDARSAIEQASPRSITLAVSANMSGQTLTWHCEQ